MLKTMLFFLVLVAGTTRAQDFSGLSSFCDSLFQTGLQEKLTPGGALVVVQDDRILLLRGYGYAQVESRQEVNAENTFFQIGSVGKVLTAIAVLQLVETGKLDLNTDVRSYLPDFPLDPNFPSAITLRHLLTHSAGFDERVIGYAAQSKAEVQPLETHLRERMPRRFQDSGVSISYSNYSYGLAGLVVEQVTGQSFTDYVQKHILTPLGMMQSTYELPLAGEYSVRYANGYRKRDTEFLVQPVFYTHVKPAGGLSSTAEEMSHLIRLLLNDGIFQGQRILQKKSLALMFERQFSNHPRLPGYTLGLEEQDISGEFAVGKGGGTLGFVSAILLFPNRKLGIFVTSNTGQDDFVQRFIENFTRHYIARPQPALAATNAQASELDRFTGVYRNNRYNHHSVENVIALFRDNFRVFKSSDNELAFYASDGIRRYRAVETLLFQNVQDQDDYIAFQEDHAGNVIHLFRSGSFAGMAVPASYERAPWQSTPNFVNEFFLSFLPAYLMSYVLYPLLLGSIFLIRFFRPGFLKENGLPLGSHLSAILFSVLATIYSFAYIARLNHAGSALAFGIPASLRLLNFIPFVLLPLLALLTFYAVKIWRHPQHALLGKLYYTGYVTVALLFLGFLYNWNFVGFHY